MSKRVSWRQLIPSNGLTPSIDPTRRELLKLIFSSLTETHKEKVKFGIKVKRPELFRFPFPLNLT